MVNVMMAGQRGGGGEGTLWLINNGCMALRGPRAAWDATGRPLTADPRRAPGARAVLGAVILTRNGGMVFDCSGRNLCSPRGALEVAPGLAVPSSGKRLTQLPWRGWLRLPPL